jgi:hypothetical protein
MILKHEGRRACQGKTFKLSLVRALNLKCRPQDFTWQVGPPTRTSSSF